MSDRTQTSVGLGVYVGIAMGIMWWLVSVFASITVPEAIVAGSVTLVTAIIQYCIPYRAKKNTRKNDPKPRLPIDPNV